MPGRSPMGPLIHEHRVIEKMLDVIRDRAASIAETGRADTIELERIADFILTYGAACHHRKEEEVLFARLAEKDIDPTLAAEMRQLIDDHERVRLAAVRIDEANRRFAEGDTGVLAGIAREMETLLETYPPHVAMEERHFFKASLDHLDETERAEILVAFEELERVVLHEKYEGVVKALREPTEARTDERETASVVE